MFAKRLRASTSNLLGRNPEASSSVCSGLVNLKRSRQSLAVLNESDYTDYDPMSQDISKMSENELRFRLRLVEAENRRLIACQGRVMADCSRKIEMHLNEIRMLREDVRRQNVENRELRDLSCFLDDERNRAKRLSREWQRFGRYTNSIMKQELQAHQQKVQELHDTNRQLTQANDELKQLCLYLDDQRAAATSRCSMTQSRCNEVASSSSAESDSSGQDKSDGGNQEEVHSQPNTSNSSLKTGPSEGEDSGHYSTPAISPSLPGQDANGHEHERSLPPIEEHHEHLLHYIRSLECRVDHLEQCQAPHPVPSADQQTMTTSLISQCSSAGTVHASSQSASATNISASSSVSQQTMVYAMQDDTDDDAGEYDLSPIREEPAELEDSPVRQPPTMCSSNTRANGVVKKAGLFLRAARTRLSLSDPTSLSSRPLADRHRPPSTRRLFRSNSLRLHPSTTISSTSSSPSSYLRSPSAGIYENEGVVSAELSRAVHRLRLEETSAHTHLGKAAPGVPCSAFGRVPSRVPGSPRCSAV